jgi:hypothetical protein
VRGQSGNRLSYLDGGICIADRLGWQPKADIASQKDLRFSAWLGPMIEDLQNGTELATAKCGKFH